MSIRQYGVQTIRQGASEAARVDASSTAKRVAQDIAIEERLKDKLKNASDCAPLVRHVDMRLDCVATSARSFRLHRIARLSLLVDFVLLTNWPHACPRFIARLEF